MRGDPDHAEGELRARELGTIELIDVDPVGDDDDTVGGPRRLRRGELGVVGAHAHDLVDRFGAHVRQPPGLELEAMQSHDEALPLPLVARVPHEVGTCPFADDHVGPGSHCLAGGRVVDRQGLPVVESQLDTGQSGEVLLDAREELQVMAGDHHAQGAPRCLRRRDESRRGRGKGPIEQSAQALGGGLHAVRRNRLGDARAEAREQSRIADHARARGGDVGLVGDEEGIVGPQQGLVHGGAIEEHGNAEHPELQDLGAQLQAGVHLRRAPGQAEIAGGCQGHGLLARHPTVPDHSGSRLQGSAHACRPLRVIGDVVDLVAHHVDLDVDALLGEEGGQPRHLEGVP